MRAASAPVGTLAAVAMLAALACHESPTATEVVAAPDPDLAFWSTLPWPFAQPTPEGPSVLVGAGDIAACDAQYQDEATALLLDGIEGTVIAVGDEAYPYGAPSDFTPCYDQSWGRHKARTRPAAGNHEYITPGAVGYFGYFGPVSNPPFGYYSYNLGGWHIIVLNSTPQVYACYPPEAHEAEAEVHRLPVWGPVQLPALPTSPTAGRACAGDVLQQAWLIGDLIANRRYRCTIVYFHHPRFSSGQHGNHYQMQRVWDILYRFQADVVVSGHDHLYERFAPQDPDGHLDTGRGVRQFTVGTGGAPLYSFVQIQPNSEVRNNTTHGVIKLTLGDGSYDWEFVPVAGSTFTDAGSDACH
jgi:calcineurin-like phosphoesterase family protein